MPNSSKKSENRGQRPSSKPGGDAGQGAREADMPDELKEESVRDADSDSSATKMPEESQHQGGPRAERGQAKRPDPNREPGGQDLDNEDVEGNVFYDENTEIKRESEVHDATGAPIGKREKVTPDSDQFHKQPRK